MDKQFLNIETIEEYNNMLGIKTAHPLVSVINLDQSKPMRHMRHTFSFYVVFLKDEKNCDIIYGRQKYDYQKGSVVCLAPRQVIGIEDTGVEFQPKGWALCFHPDLIKGTSLSSHIKEYSYFSYEVNEALHVSDTERDIIIDCLHKIEHELLQGNDRLTKRLISTNIELLLDYCLRFYERQFNTRKVANTDILIRFEALLESYFSSDRLKTDGIPSVKWCADQLCLSPNYFGDLVKKETGLPAKEHIQSRLISIAKEEVLSPRKSISEIAYELGFQYPQHLTRMFKKFVGMTPNEYRESLLK